MAGNLDRDLHAVGSNRAVLDLLRSVFVAELLHPSRRLWIVSPWVSDIQVIDNTARQFSTLCPEWPADQIRLTAILIALMERGTQVVIVVNKTHHNDDVITRLNLANSAPSELLIVIRAEELHEKGILGDHFTLNGSMNLTFNGVHVNDEYLTYRCSPAAVEQRRLELQNRWRAQLCS